MASVGSTANIGRDRANGLRALEGYWVIPDRDRGGEEVFAVVGPTGVPLYTFTDLRDAVAEATELNGRRKH
jgi:hypothetical protein